VYATAETAARVAAEGGGVLGGALAVPVDRRALAGEAVEVFAPGAAHTPDNVVVWLPARGVLFGGCMIRPAGARSLGNLADADLATWPASALRVAERYAEARVVVPSHGDPGGPSLLAETVALAHASVSRGDAAAARGAAPGARRRGGDGVRRRRAPQRDGAARSERRARAAVGAAGGGRCARGSSCSPPSR
jgi:glyoxylase-like metal-dependent hydrolase (beta-lactamase superfamily II)